VKTIIGDLDKVLESRIRLAVMSILAVNDVMEYPALKDLLDITDGNLASHIAVLERRKYVSVRKRFIGRKPVTMYSITHTGRRAFTMHVDALEKLIRHSR